MKLKEHRCNICDCLGNEQDKNGNPCNKNNESCGLDKAGVCPCCNKNGR